MMNVVNMEEYGSAKYLQCNIKKLLIFRAVESLRHITSPWFYDSNGNETHSHFYSIHVWHEQKTILSLILYFFVPFVYFQFIYTFYPCRNIAQLQLR